eukprot:TRINITY_DN31654_c0_g2_i1.p1 TRINITY_DN31654_c0_g2~~TRINITY_DN31654_c0_g2_i1.p1  ORF type:complete len:147 (-),score=6.73 TRINITY_DN31654_c0_g2_i1:51-491(-)
MSAYTASSTVSSSTVKGLARAGQDPHSCSREVRERDPRRITSKRGRASTALGLRDVVQTVRSFSQPRQSVRSLGLSRAAIETTAQPDFDAIVIDFSKVSFDSDSDDDTKASHVPVDASKPHPPAVPRSEATSYRRRLRASPLTERA